MISFIRIRHPPMRNFSSSFEDGCLPKAKIINIFLKKWTFKI